jgi:hypothetical protein
MKTEANMRVTAAVPKRKDSIFPTKGKKYSKNKLGNTFLYGKGSKLQVANTRMIISGDKTDGSTGDFYMGI